MTITIRKIWEKVSNLGISIELSTTEHRKVVLLNQMAFVVAILQFFINIQFAATGHFVQFLIGIAIVLFTVSILILNKLALLLYARIFATVFYPLVIFSISIAYGQHFNVSYAYFVFILFSIIFYRRTEIRLFLICWNVSLYFIGEFHMLHHPPLFEQLEFTFFDRYIIFLCSVTCITLVINNYIEQSEAYKKELKNMLASLELNNKELQLANNELERFAYIASHDLKTPLRTIVSYLDLIERKTRQNDYGNIDKFIAFAQKGARHMNDIVSEVLEYSKLNMNHHIPMETVDLNEIVRNNAEQLHSLIKDKNGNIVANKLPIIKGNKMMLGLLFQNIIENGIKYNENEQPLVEINAKNNSENILITFKDNGIGIASEFQQNIFELFSRLHTEQEYYGTGMGLAVCRKIIERFNGQIWVESQKEKGSIFYISLPL